MNLASVFKNIDVYEIQYECFEHPLNQEINQLLIFKYSTVCVHIKKQKTKNKNNIIFGCWIENQ